ncbi:hypothetical protein [Planctomycetes bacterium Poly30]|uniref:hypothetical protein n=1 Tax=Saltatorellus ferox TaxID=2528018 RepID=UPI0011A95BE1
MTHDIPRSVQDAASVLLRACLSAARNDTAVAASLRTLTTYLHAELGAGTDSGGSGGGAQHPSARATAGEGAGAHTVLTPPGRPRDGEGARTGSDGKGRQDGRIAEPLAVVVTRARWKAAACRLALQRRENQQAPEEERPALEAQAASREKSLRSRLGALPDTSAWMLDFPFGKRVTEPDAFEVDAATAAKLENIADCYETVATGAEIARDLDESGAFRGGPPPAFLYLLAEAQSALLHSLQEAPTRTDSDQRDVFLWLKDQTTRYRIYVDRHMRLDDPADVTGSSGLQERMRRSARDAMEERNARRERGQILSKIRYHVGKIVADQAPLHSEVDSLRQALERWSEAGNAVTDKGVLDALRPLRPHASKLKDSGTKEEVYELLAESGMAPVDGDPLDGTRDHVVTPTRSGGAAATKSDGPGQQEGDHQDPAKVEHLLEEMRQLLAGKHVVLCCEPTAEADTSGLLEGLGAETLTRLEIEVEADAVERWAKLDGILDAEGADLILLGVRLPAAEYQRFKEACLERHRPFVRLPGAFTAAAIAHQISRQVGWRLRTQGTSKDR